MTASTAAAPWPNELFEAAPTGVGEGVAKLRADSGELIVLDVERWHTEPSPGELSVLTRAVGPVLDIGCGPGRLLVALGEMGVTAVGIDSCPSAVTTSRQRGGAAVLRSVFDPVPIEGHWRTVLLLDGNIGIGGDAKALLGRIRALLAPGGRVLVEVEPPRSTARRLRVRVEHRGQQGPWFAWAQVAAHQVPHLARGTGLRNAEIWHCDGRWFAMLTKPGGTVG